MMHAVVEFLRTPPWGYELCALLSIYPALLIFRRAGLPQWWAFLIFIPIAGVTACAGVLALKKWPAGEAR